jgi:hypothetical protein
MLHNRNHFPPHYAENISEQNLPVELFQQYTTVEYELQVPVAGEEGGRVPRERGGREGGRGMEDKGRPWREQGGKKKRFRTKN